MNITRLCKHIVGLHRYKLISLAYRLKPPWDKTNRLAIQGAILPSLKHACGQAHGGLPSCIAKLLLPKERLGADPS